MKPSLSILTSIAMLYAATALGADYIPRLEVRLPQERYVQKLVKVEMIASTPCEIPIVEDTWASLRAKKVSELERVMEDQDECKSFSITPEGISCIKITSDCIKDGPKYTEVCGDKGCRDKYDGTECKEWGPTYSYAAYTISYHDITTLHSEDHWYRSDSTVYIADKSIDFKTSSSATRAAALLEDLRYISVAINDDVHHYAIKKKADEAPKICKELREKEKAREEQDRNEKEKRQAREELRQGREKMEECIKKSKTEEEKDSCLKEIVDLNSTVLIALPHIPRVIE